MDFWCIHFFKEDGEYVTSPTDVEKVEIYVIYIEDNNRFENTAY